VGNYSDPETPESHFNVLTVSKEMTAMAANQMVQTRIDGAIKKEAAAVLAAMGLTLSDAVRLLLTRVAHDKALPFEPLIPIAITIEAMNDARLGRGVTKAASLDALFVDLNADT
jgi:DNA-damage-inducible protein J